MIVQFILGLNNVKHKQLDKTIALSIKESLIKNITNKLGIKLMFLNPFTFVDGTSCGLAFAIDKLDDKFSVKLSSSKFRYKDTEVQNVLTEIIEQYDLAPRVMWDRGNGVFVYNLYFKPE